jgi:hypothetical protein
MRAFGSETILIVPRAIILAVFAKESALSQRLLTDSTFETLDVEVLVLDTQHLTRALLLTTLTLRLACNNSTSIKINQIKKMNKK